MALVFQAEVNPWGPYLDSSSPGSPNGRPGRRCGYPQSPVCTLTKQGFADGLASTTLTLGNAIGLALLAAVAAAATSDAVPEFRELKPLN